jgi:spermidine synthase
LSTRIIERHDASYGAWFEATDVLESARSEWQEIQIIETEVHGRIMLIDGLAMLTDRTHFVYHEHMAHIPAACVDELKDVLIIGGGDGGVVTELVKYDGIESIVLAELDGLVVDVSRRWFPEVAKGLDDPRVTIEIGDGAAYIADKTDAYDLVIIDSTDISEEVTHVTDTAFPLSTDEFFANLKTAMRPGAAAIQVLGNPFFHPGSIAKLLPRLKRLWPKFEVVSMPTPFYISGDWAAGLYSVDGKLTPRNFRLPAERLEYINPQTARGALAQPNFVRRMVKRAPARKARREPGS